MKEEATWKLQAMVAPKEISVDASIMAILSELEAIFKLQEAQKNSTNGFF